MEFTGERVVPNRVSDDLFNEHISRYMFAARFIQPEHSIIDIGCGAGYGTYELSKTASTAVGVDISEEAINYSNQNYSSENLSYICADSKKLELNYTFDIAVSFEVIEHIDEVDLYLESVKRCLKDEGLFIVSTPNKKMYSDAIDGYNNVYHVKEYYHDEFVDRLNKHFRNVVIYSQQFLQGLLFRRNDIEIMNSDIEYAEHEIFDKESASFFIAVCSNSPLQLSNDQSMLYTVSNNNILSEKDRHIKALKNEVEIRDLSFDMETERLNSEIAKRDIIIENYQAIAERLNDEVPKRDSIIEHYKKDNEKLLNWIEIANNETLKRDSTVAHLQREIETLNDFINQIQRERR
ncbi:class I SAM-dependent methyltransferase [Paenibacillus sp. YIM B09110]|uniref:class I SAM-dependent methyltransferase n=1 Tax=Paenibacillus sp. YIM B09110 TaxID=3126102 RepID=UPI00301CB49C